MNNFIKRYFARRTFSYPYLYSAITKNLDPRLDTNVIQAHEFLSEEYNKKIESIPIEVRHEKNIQPSPIINTEATLLNQIYDWYTKGKVTYKISHSLMDLLAFTDVMEDKFDINLLPYETFFLDFGDTDMFRLNHGDNKYFLTGAFIARLQHILEIRLVTQKEGGYHSNWVLDPEIVKYVDLDFSSQATLKELLEKSYQDNLNNEEDNFNNLKKHTKQLMDDPEFFGAPRLSINEDNHLKRIEDRKEANYLIKECAALIFNTILYLLSEKPDIVNQNPVKTSNSNLSNLPKPKKIMSELNFFRDGKYRFFDVGHSFENHVKIKGIGSEKSTHWRRGHFRNQPFGVGLTEKKIIWIKPTIIRKDREDHLVGKEVSVD